jgi:hypothetical protein
MKLALLIVSLATAIAVAGPFESTSLSFDALSDGEQVLSFYNGGLGGLGSGPGPNEGVSFTNGLAADATEIAFGPSARLTAPSVIMNLDVPWSGNISFYYAGEGSISFYAGLNGSGSLVDSFVLPFASQNVFDARPGTYESVVFTGAGVQLDSISFGESSVIPEPASVTLWSLAVVSFAILRRRTLKRQGRRLP